MPPLFTEDTVSLTDIHETDNSFRITTEVDKDSKKLINSLAEVGPMTPPILKKNTSGKYLIVTGFRRLAALKSLNVDDVICRLLPPDTEGLDCLKLSITDNVCQRSLNPGEQARALARLATFFEDVDGLRQAAADLSLPSSKAEIEKLQIAAGLPTEIFDYLSCEQIPLSVAVALARMDDAPAVMLADIFADLKLGVNKQREVLTLTEEIAAREDKTVMQVLEDDGLRRIVDDEQADRGRRAAALRSWLQHRRYPAIMEKQGRFAEKARSLNLGNRMSLAAPANFEGPDYVLKLTFKNMEELDTHSRRLADIIANPGIMKELLD